MTKKTHRADLVRKANNERITRALRTGQPLTPLFSTESSWFPPRPRIEKDPKAIEKLYGRKPKHLSLKD